MAGPSSNPTDPTQQDPTSNFPRTKTSYTWWIDDAAHVFGTYSESTTVYTIPNEATAYTIDCPVAPKCDTVSIESTFPIELSWEKNECCPGAVTITSDSDFIFDPPFPFTTYGNVYVGTVKMNICDRDLVDKYKFNIVGCDGGTTLNSYLHIPNITNAQEKIYITNDVPSSNPANCPPCDSCCSPCPPCPPLDCNQCCNPTNPNLVVNVSMTLENDYCDIEKFKMNFSYPDPCPEPGYIYYTTIYENISGTNAIYNNYFNISCGPTLVEFNYGVTYTVIITKIEILTGAINTLTYTVYRNNPFIFTCAATITNDPCELGKTGKITLSNNINIAWFTEWFVYTTSWVSIPGTSNLRELTGLDIGKYKVIVKIPIPNTAPVEYCIKECEYEITGSPIDIDVVIDNACSIVGSVIFSVTGGDRSCLACGEGLEYSIDSGEWIRMDSGNQVVLTGLSIGTHIIKVKDCGCCIKSQSFTITDKSNEIKLW